MQIFRIGIPKKAELRHGSVLYKLDESAPNCPVEQEDNEPMPPGNSGSNNPVNDAVPPSHKSQMHQSNYKTIPRHRFGIKGEVAWWHHKIVQDKKFVNEALSNPNAKE